MASGAMCRQLGVAICTWNYSLVRSIRIQHKVRSVQQNYFYCLTRIVGLIMCVQFVCCGLSSGYSD